MKSILKVGLFCLITAALIITPATLNAQETNKHAEKKIVKEKAGPRSGFTPFHGKIKAVDKTAKTITIGETTIQITSETKLNKAGKPATLDDATVGEMVAGAYKKSEDGKLNATTVRIGSKPAATHEGEAVKEKTKKVN